MKRHDRQQANDSMTERILKRISARKHIGLREAIEQERQEAARLRKESKLKLGVL